MGPVKAPHLVVIIDAEEEFDWGVFDKESKSITSIARQGLAQAIFDLFGVRPTYAVTYPVAAHPDGYLPLREFLVDRKCEIASHLHPWVTPPIEEELGPRNSFLNNLPADLERRKIITISSLIQANFGVRPTSYKAGRYGLARSTFDTLEQLGYQIDLSVFPRMDLRRQFGPDFTEYGITPFWAGRHGSILSIPTTSEFIGPLALLPPRILNMTRASIAERLKIPSVLSSLGLLDKVSLHLESVPLSEAKQLTRDMIRRGAWLFVVSYHSTSLLPGATEYVRNDADLKLFLKKLADYCDFFFGQLGGVATTPGEVRDIYLADRPS